MKRGWQAVLWVVAMIMVILLVSSNPIPGASQVTQQNFGAPGSAGGPPRAFSVPITAPPAGTGGTATTNVAGRANAVGRLLSEAPILPNSGEKDNENDREADPVTPMDLNPVVKTTAPTTPELAPPKQAQLIGAASPNAPTAPTAAFVYYQSKDLGGGASLIGEPSQASDGLLVFETWNWGAGISKDGGRSWGYLNPYTLFPASYGGFCCDQVVYYDQTHDITFWILQYSVNASNNNAIRVAWANGATNLTNAAFCYTDFTPQQLGSPTGTNYDQPKFARSDNDIYLEMTQYGAASGNIVIRVAASAFTSACNGVGYQWYAPGLFSPGFTQRGYTDMYFAAHVSNSTLRVFDWPESAANYTGITTHDVSHTAYPVNLPNRCPRTGGTATSDWCQRRSFGGGWAHTDRIFTGWQIGGIITFVWDATQGNNGVGGFTFAYPYTHIVRINQSTFALINEPIQWSSGFAINYATAALDDRYHVAGTVLWGGGSYYENCAAWIADDLSPGYTGVGFFPSGTWEWYNGPDSNIDPTDLLSGDYISARRNAYAPNTWGGSCYSLLNNGSGGVSVHPYYLWFGRGRDTPVIPMLFLPLIKR